MITKAIVEVDIFSGRPNPVWTLSDVEAATLVEKLSALPPAPAKILSNPLGYRGLIVQMIQGSQDYTIQIQQGGVRVMHAGASSYFEDRDRSLELWLVSTGKPWVSDEVFKLIEAELAPMTAHP
ncbi:MAG TPA: hypothetical protein VES89_00895 [Candidatus Competibacteraceae bacterium]|nr:hypothetical protein [Candidatus Competibacteraceae bacterium]